MDGKLLCVRLKPYFKAAPEEYDFWCLPGGGVDEGEPLVEAFKREMTEELGVEPKVGRLLYVHQFHRGDNKDIVEFFFNIENPEDYRNIDLTKTTHGADEIEAIEFSDPKNTHLKPEFLTTEDLPGFIAGNHPPKFFAKY